MSRMFCVIGFCLLGSIYSIFYFGGKADTGNLSEIECKKNNGKWISPPSQILNTKIDMSYCVLPTVDAGEVCESSKQCDSVCIVDVAVKQGMKTLGECFKWSDTIGHCLNTVENGTANGEVCFD